MSKSDRAVQVPGADAPALPTLELNNTDLDPNEMAAQQEARVATTHAQQLLADGKVDEALAMMKDAAAVATALRAEPPALVDEAPRAASSVYGDEVERVSMPAIRRNTDVDKYGPEVSHPVGTRLDADFQPCSGAAEAVYYVGSLLIKGRGWLINRPIPIEGGPADPRVIEARQREAAERQAAQQEAAA